jgi:cupin 2 domain-containing protein
MKTGNLFETVSGALPTEVVEVLARGQGELKIERIVSRGHASPSDFWYDSETTEWVVLLQGCAVLQFASDEELTEMVAGDWIEIPARCRHRVEATAGDEDTVWLAVHWG